LRPSRFSGRGGRRSTDQIEDMETSKDFEEFFELLNSRKVHYVVVGGYAFAVHAKPKYTGDIDVFVDSSTANAQNLLKVLEEFGFGELGISLEDLTKADQVIQLGNPPLRIDILTSISGVSFQEAWKNKITGKYGEQAVNFIGKADLIRNKKASGRKKDMLDLEDLQ
jgi:hypothetical protein